MSDDESPLWAKAQRMARERFRAERERALRDEPDPRAIVALAAPLEIEEIPGANFMQILAAPRHFQQSDHLLGTVFFEGRTEEYVIFVDYSVSKGGRAIPRLDKVSDEFLIESIQEIGEYMTANRVDSDDGDLLIRHLNAEIIKRLDSRAGSA